MKSQSPAQKADQAYVAAIESAGGLGRGALPCPALPKGGQVVSAAVQRNPEVAGVRRPVAAINMAGIEPMVAASDAPRFEWVNPTSLLIDGAYQRALSESSVKLIRKIVGGWDWRKFKPPVCASSAEGLLVIDGQHTAIAAASHPSIETIPVMIVDAVDRADQAAAFIGHNKDRINITKGQMHFASLAAGDEDAQTVAQVCERAGVTILRNPPANSIYKPGDTVALVSVQALIARRGAMRSREILQALVQARCAPVGAQAIKAVETLMFDAEYKGEVTLEEITTALIAIGPEGAEREAKVFAASHNVPIWRGLAVVLFRRASRGRRRKA